MTKIESPTVYENALDLQNGSAVSEIVVQDDTDFRYRLPNANELQGSQSNHISDEPRENVHGASLGPRMLSQSQQKSGPALTGQGDVARIPTSDASVSTASKSTQPETVHSKPTLIRPIVGARTVSIPVPSKSPMLQSPPNIADPVMSSSKQSKDNNMPPSAALKPLPSPLPSAAPWASFSLPTYLQIELSSHRSSTAYTHDNSARDFPYESSRVKLERLRNFLLLPLHLEAVMLFGVLACLDAWLYTFTILPLRLSISIYILFRSWWANLRSEADFMFRFVYTGAGRVWRRQTHPRASRAAAPVSREPLKEIEAEAAGQKQQAHDFKRAQFIPSTLLPDDKADLLKGLLIIFTCVVLLKLDASRMYHWVRGQADLKLYVIYNVLEVCDRLFSALGQDVLECLFSREVLERKANGHSKVLRPFWLFLLALVYTVSHTTALFYQTVTLNVAVNSYSNALITLLLSNQFVEIKSTVFKKIEKENLFQLTCADVVERFQLWLMMTIIASRNIMETGGFKVGLVASSSTASSAFTAPASNMSESLDMVFSYVRSSAVLPRSFTLLPMLMNSVTAHVPAIAHVLGPFVVVLGSEMLVDWLKHAYVSKFNNTRPAVYDRFLDVFASDYYLNAFSNQNLFRRLGLPVIPLSCLFIRASVQTYHMFTAAWTSLPVESASTTLSSIHEEFTASTAFQPSSTTAMLSHKIDIVLRQLPAAVHSSGIFTILTISLVFALVFLLLLAMKLVLGMLLLIFARPRYWSTKERQRRSSYHIDGAKRHGGWGVVEVDDEKRTWIYDDDLAGLRLLREREEKEKAKREKGIGEALEKIQRYELGGTKRIW